MSTIKCSSSAPADGIRLTEQQAEAYAWELVGGWQESRDTWALRYGAAALGGLCSISGFFINSHFRTRLRLGQFGAMSTLLPTVLLPGVFCSVFHRLQVSSDILMQRKQTCSLCYELQAVSYQLACGVLYPMIMAPLSTFMLANRYNTIRIPSLVQQPRELLAFLVRTSRSQSGLLAALVATHVAAASLITYCELRNNLQLSRKLSLIEQKLQQQTET